MNHMKLAGGRLGWIHDEGQPLILLSSLYTISNVIQHMHTHTHIQSKPFASFSVLFYFPFHSYQSNLIAPSSQRRSIRAIWGHVDAVFRIIMSIRSICCFDSAFQVKILESMWICHALKWPMYLYIIQSTYGLAFAKCIRFASKLRRTENYTIIHSRVHPYGWGKNIFAL